MSHGNDVFIDEKLSYCRRDGAPALLDKTIPRHFHEIVRQFPESEAVVSIKQGRRLSYAALEGKVDHLARALLAAGFQKGDRIGIWSTNNIEWLVQMATARLGIILVNINPAYRPAELVYALQRSEVQGIFTIPSFRKSNYARMVMDALPGLEFAEKTTNLQTDELPDLRQVIIYDPDDASNTQKPAAGFTSWQEFMAGADSINQGAVEKVTDTLKPDEAINIQYTSGTTGFPKAVVLTHHNILNNAWFGAQAMHFSNEDRLCVSVPFYHCFGMVLANLLCLSVGACIVIPGEHFNADDSLKAVHEERCTAIHGVPTMFIGELDSPHFDEYDLTCLRTGIMAGAPCPPELMKKVMDVMHVPEILIGYGQTEASPLTHLTTREDSFDRRVNSVGTNLPHQEACVVDKDSGETVAIGETGEICFRGYHVMQGYYNDSEATNKAIDKEGWLHSGDLGTMDKDGYVRITGRLKEMIIRGGENIYPAEIENALFEHEAIDVAAVFGIADEKYGEEVAAWIKLHEGKSLDEEGVRVFLKERLAHFKIPHVIRFVDDFPMTVTGKLQKFKMAEIEAGEA